jgi:predicted transcriptional regulator
MQEDYKTIDLRKEEEQRLERRGRETLEPLEPRHGHREGLITQEALEGLVREKAARASRRKWAGRLLIVFGVILMLGSCPFYVISGAGSGTIFAALGLIGGGSALLAWRPRLKNTNEAILIAMKYGNRLTATTLALEMDISFNKAEKIIQELVRSGIAEIDLDHKDPDHTITYKIKGL